MTLLLGVVFAIGALSTLLLSDAFSYIQKGAGPVIQRSFYFSVIVAGLALVSAFALQNIPYHAHKIARETADRQAASDAEKKAAAEELERRRSAAALALVKSEMTNLEKRLKNVEKRDVAGRVVITGRTAAKPISGVNTQTFEAAVLGKDGKRQAYIIVYLFPNEAFWAYQRFDAFEDANGAPMPFLQRLGTGEFISRLQGQQKLIAVGLQSNTAGASDYAYRRAASLCGSLFAMTGGKTVEVFGVSLGRYGGEPQAANELSERRQRSVVIVGVRDVAEGVDAGPIVPEILKLVAIPGVDLSGYRETSSPRWVTVKDCKAPH